jgi:hypothetical protein
MVMSTAPHDLTHEILKQIRADIADFRRSVDDRFEQVDKRFDAIEDLVRRQRKDSAAMLVMMRSVVGTFNERVTATEDRLATLEVEARQV